jgi:hypothetical protein
MDKCTQKLVNDVIETVLSTVNMDICFYRKRPTLSKRLSLEETVINNLPLADLLADKSPEGKRLQEKLKKLHACLITRLPIFPIEIELPGVQA